MWSRGGLRFRLGVVAFVGFIACSVFIGLVVGGRIDPGEREALVFPFAALSFLGAAVSGALAMIVVSSDIRALGSMERTIRTLTTRGQMPSIPMLGGPESRALGQSLADFTSVFYQDLDSLEREHARLEAVLDSMTDGVVIVESEDTVSLVNRAAGELLDVTPRLEGSVSLANGLRDIDLVELIQESSRDRSASRLFTIDATNREVHGVVVPLGRRDDRQRLVLLRDLTKLRQAENIRRDFVANVSHELRTPVTVLRAMVETLEAGAVDDPQTRADFLRRIVVETDRLGQIITELLDLARIESGMADLALEKVDLNMVVGPTAERLRPQAVRNDLQLEIAQFPEHLPVEADTDRMGRVVMSLVHNAIKFTSPGGTISVIVERLDQDAVVRVVDTGQGLDPGERERVFERFYKADASRSGSGSGLGLAIARHTVRQHGGRIWVESPGRGHGSTFGLTLPLHAAHDQEKSS
tara:strand:+ start:246 stop:1652 length:1407 start_codon:yes stop_codon:yes gene_type:complete